MHNDNDEGRRDDVDDDGDDDDGELTTLLFFTPLSSVLLLAVSILEDTDADVDAELPPLAVLTLAVNDSQIIMREWTLASRRGGLDTDTEMLLL